MKRKNRKWYYVSYYESYPIYEPAEGGYYYEGESLENFERFGSLKSAKRFLRKKLKNVAENPSLIISENMKQGKADQAESVIVGVCALKQFAENINEAGSRIVRRYHCV